MRIALAVTEFPSASQTFVLDHACGLVERGHAVALHALKAGALREPHAGIAKFGLLKNVHYAPPPLPTGSRVASLLRFIVGSGMHWLRQPRLFWRFMRMPAGNRFDVMRRCISFWSHAAGYDLIHAHSGYSARRLMPLYDTSDLHTPLIVTFHGHDVHAYLLNRPENFYTPIFARAAALVVCSDFMRQRLLALNAPPEKLHVIPNAVSIDSIAFRERHMPQGTVLRLLTIGRLVPFKGLTVLIKALQHPAICSLNWRLDVVGEGPLRAELIAQAEAAGLDDRIVFNGACTRERVLSLINASDLYLAPAIVDADGNTETQGVALLEAMASGLPIIASHVGGIPETLGNSAAALVPPNDADALAAALLDLLQHPENWGALGLAGRKRVEQHYDQKTWIGRLEMLYLQAKNA